MPAIGSGLPPRRTIGLALLTLAIAEALGVGAFYVHERAGMHARRNDTTVREPDPGGYFLKTAAKPLRTPPVVADDRAAIGPDEEILGVVVEGRARAYRLAALRDRDRHVVNDLVGGRPVSVAFCDVSGCATVYTDPKGDAPLDVASAGLYDGGMVVRVGGFLYLQKTGEPMSSDDGAPPIPYESPGPLRMTWSRWRALHPETDVYEGVPKRVGNGE